MSQEPDYGSGARAVRRTSNRQPRYIRITDFGDDGIEAGHEYMTADPIESDCELAQDDLLFARSGATVGKTYLHEDTSEPAIFAGYCIRFRFDRTRALPKFIYWGTKTDFYARWVATIQRPAGQPNINKEEFKSFEIPLPAPQKQAQLVAAMDAARAERQAKLAEADALLAGLDGYLLTTLGLTLPPEDARKTFAVSLASIRKRRFDPPAFQPLYAKGHPPKTPLRNLEELAQIDAHTATKPTNENTLVPYIGLPECDQTEVREVVMRPYHEVRGRSVVRPGDILFARIEPSIFNKKYVLVEDLKGHPYAYTSTEFYVVTPRVGVAVGEYLYAMFFCSFVFAQSQGKTSGSSGRRRLDSDLFRTLQIPAPDLAVQEHIAAEARRRRDEARRLRAEAEACGQTAKHWFEKQLLGSVQP